MAPGKRDFKPRKGGGPPGRLHKTAKKKGKPAKLPSLKNQIRGVQRLLQKVGWAALEAWPPSDACTACPSALPAVRASPVGRAGGTGTQGAAEAGGAPAGAAGGQAGARAGGAGAQVCKALPQGRSCQGTARWAVLALQLLSWRRLAGGPLAQRTQLAAQQLSLHFQSRCRPHAAQVRFFERVKIERRLHKLQGKQQQGAAGLSSEEQAELERLQQDLQVWVWGRAEAGRSGRGWRCRGVCGNQRWPAFAGSQAPYSTRVQQGL